jgi:hypothetical protein
MFGVGKFRISVASSVVEQTNFKLDGVTVEGITSPVSGNLYLYNSSAMNIPTLGRHTIGIERSGISGIVYLYAIDYYTPTFEPQVWTMNPHKERLIGGSSIATPQPANESREISLNYGSQTALANNTAYRMVGRGHTVLDAGTYKCETAGQGVISATGLTYSEVYLSVFVNGVVSFYGDTGGAKFNSTQWIGNMSSHRTITLTKRSIVFITFTAVSDGTVSDRQLNSPTLTLTRVGN